MFRAINVRALSITFTIAALAQLAGHPSRAADRSPEATLVNRGVVEIETSGSTYTSTRIAEDIASIIDDGATRRIVPVLGRGPVQNLLDLKYLRGIDLAIIQSDAFDYAREQHLLPGNTPSFTYVAKLYNDEFHLLVRADIKTISDLANQTVNIDVRDSGTALTATRLLNLVRAKVTTTNDSQELALQKLREGKIAALAFLVAKPAPLFQGLRPKDGLHLLSIPLTAAVTDAYVPTRIVAADYPDFVSPDQPVDTVAVGNVLMAADLRMLPERHRNVSNAVEALFTGFQTLLEPGHHPKWQEVNIAADFPGWQRHQQAAQWLQRNIQVAAAPKPDILKAMFSQFIDERRQAGGGGPMSSDEKDTLFEQFQAWQRGQAR
jgi:uncharacterized protein